MDVFDIPDGEVVQIRNKLYVCGVCGKFAENITFFAYATSDYKPDDSGVLRRKFRFVGQKPVCDCHKYVWLASEKNDAQFSRGTIWERLFSRG